MHLCRIRDAAAVIWLACFPFLKSHAQEISRQPPEIYREKLAALLTPLDKVLHGQSAAIEKNQDNSILLDEEIHYIDDKGRRYFVDHRVYKALTDSGVKELSDETHSYRKANQKIHLVLAQTIQPDGRRMPVQPGAVILQTPQRQADYSLYDDTGELRLIFPNVKPGTVTESIVVTEESYFRIPGEFTASFVWAYGWPMQKIRRVVEMPDALSQRLKTTILGQGVPEPVKENPEKGRVRLTWSSDGIEALPQEDNLPPTRQVGPVMWLTTLPDWDAFVRWYEPLLHDRATLKPTLAKQIDEWTKDAHAPEEILGIIMAKVSTDVRYVGLEFGESDLQPHDCNDVWENQYGDCKDKANLLRAMLRYKNITAHLVLLNTEYTGIIERRSPDYRQFSHAIAAVELEPGKLIFCDPTIPCAKPGMLSPSDADRDVLLVKNNAAEWSRTPAQDAGILNYDFDLKLGADGGISGWLTLGCDGYYGVSYRDDYERLDKQSTLGKAHDIVRDFFKGVEIVDVTKGTVGQGDGYQLKMYFIVPGANNGQQGKLSLAFPQAPLLFISTGARKKRETPFYMWPDTVKVSAHIRLPQGFAPAELPAPYRLESPALDIAARWESSALECTAALELHTKQNLATPEQFEVIFNSLLSAHAWLDNPILLSASAEKTAAPPEKASALEDFPMMPTGEGQVELVEQRFPDGSDTGIRREALKKVIQYFPSDKPTLFTAGVKLAIMDWEDRKPQQAVAQIRGLLQNYRDSITAESAAWGDYMLALALCDAEKEDDARALLQSLADNGGISQYRRAWAGYELAKILQKKSPAAAVKILRTAYAVDCDARPAVFTLLAKLLLLEGHAADLKKEIAQLAGKNPAQSAATLANLAEAAADLLPAEKAAERTELFRLLDEAAKTSDLGKRFNEALSNAHSSIRANGAAAQIRSSLKKYLEKNPPEKLPAEAAQFKTRADFFRAMDAAEKDRKPELCLRYGLELLVRFEPDPDFPSCLWGAANNADWSERFHEKDEPLLPVLLDLCDQLPANNSYFYEGRFLRSRVLARHEKYAAAQKIIEELLRDASLSPNFKVSAHSRLAEYLEKERDYSRALEIYRASEPEIEYAKVKDGLLRAVFLNLEAGKRDEAFRLLDLLAERSPESVKQASTGAQIAEMVALSRDKKKAAAYWDSAAKWWPEWLALEKKLGMKPLDGEQVVPAIPDLTALGADLGDAIRTKDHDAFCSGIRVLAHGARWQPSLVPELANASIFITSRFAPESVDDLRQFVLSLHDSFQSGDPELARTIQLYGAIAAIDSNQTARALKIIRAFEEKPQRDDAITQAVVRLWGIAAQSDKSEAAPAIAALEKLLVSGNFQDKRAMTITLLADLCHQYGRLDDEEKMLKREMENAQVKSVPADLQAVTARYGQLKQSANEAQQLTKAVETWLKKHRLEWYDYAEPKSLDDPRLSDLDAVLNNPAQIFSAPETVKLQFLVALSPAQPVEKRQNAFIDALQWLLDTARTQDEARTIFEPLIYDSDFSEWVRVEALWRAVNNLRNEGRLDDFKSLHACPLTAQFSDKARTACGIYLDVLAVDTNAPDAVAAFCGRLLEKPLYRNSINELRRAYTRLLELGDLAAAEKIYRRLADASLAADAPVTRTALQMEFLKSLNRAKKWAPAVAAMQRLVMAQFPAESIVEPAFYKTLQDPRNIGHLSESDATAARLYQIKTRQCDLSDTGFWEEFLGAIERTDANRKLTFDLLAALLENAPGDAERAASIDVGLDVIDLDDETLRAAFTKLVQPYRNLEKFPDSYAAIRVFEVRYAWRTGRPADVETDLAGLQNPSVATIANIMRLAYYTQTRNLPVLKKILERASPDELLTGPVLKYSVRAFEAAGMKDELELARDAAKKETYRAILLSWATQDTAAFSRALFTAEALRDSSILPQAWSAQAAKIHHRRDNLSIRAMDAAIREDWPLLLSLSDEAIPLFPTHYHFYWLKGAALCHLGKKNEAAEPLKIYTRYAKDESDYPQAVEWLKELQQPAK